MPSWPDSWAREVVYTFRASWFEELLFNERGKVTKEKENFYCTLTKSGSKSFGAFTVL
jgi:hypothetical protein